LFYLIQNEALYCPEEFQNNEVIIIAEDYDYMKNLKLYIRFLHFFDGSNQTSITSVRNKIF